MQPQKITKNNEKKQRFWNYLPKIIGIGIFTMLLFFWVSEYLKSIGNYGSSISSEFFNIIIVISKITILASIIIFLVKIVSKNREENWLKIAQRSLFLKIFAYLSLTIIYGLALFNIYVHTGCTYGFYGDCYLVPGIIEMFLTTIIIIISIFWLLLWLILRYYIKEKNDIKIWKFIGIAGITIALLMPLLIYLLTWIY